MLRLQGVGVLVTRPEQQAERLCALLEAEGAVAVRLPAIDIKPVPGAHDFDAGRMASPPFDLVDLHQYERRAVRRGAARAPAASCACRHRPRHGTRARIRPATARR